MANPVVRVRVVQLVFAAAIVVVVGRAAQVQLVEGARYRAAAEAQRTERIVLPARRGGLFDRNGVALALTQEIYHVGVAPNELREPARDARTIARQLGLSPSAVARALRKRYAYFHGPFSATQVAELRPVRGVHLTSELVRFHPDPDLARPLLGLPAADGRPASGLERVYDSLLVGTDGHAVVLRDRRGQRYDSPSRLDAFPTPGHDVVLTIDAQLQEIVEQALAEAIDRHDALGGDVVVLDPRTGELLAVASRAARGASAVTAFTSVFEPGSTAKLFAAAALLTHGLATPDARVWAEQGTYVLRGRTIEDEHPSGWLTLQGVIEQSSNIGIAKLTADLTPAQQYEMLRDFGLGTPTGIAYPAESGGILRRPRDWSGTSAASLAMGYEVAVTPLQLAAAYGAIANGGVLLHPALVREVRRSDGRVVSRHVPEPVRRVVTPDVADALRRMLRGVVYRGGTGETAALSTFEVAGKTGTARRAGPGGYIPGSYTASFASLFPADDPQLVMVVKLDDPKQVYARVTAAPVTRAVLEQLLAARSDVLDWARLSAVEAAPAEAGRPAGAAAIHVVAWPPEPSPPANSLHRVPDVVGLSVRDAAQALHAAGLRARVRGWGSVTAMHPAAGAMVRPRSLVDLAAERRGTVR